MKTANPYRKRYEDYFMYWDGTVKLDSIRLKICLTLIYSI